MSVLLNTRGDSIATALEATPAVLRGTLNLNMYITINGGTLGTGVTQAQRQANATALNAGIAYALANSLEIISLPARCEIENTGGITFMPNTTYNGVWHSAGFKIVQYALNEPCITFGDVTGTNHRGGMRVSGVIATHGVDQSGQTNASAMRFGSIFWSSFSYMTAGSTGMGGSDPRSYNCVNIDGNNAAFFFSNSMRDFVIAGAYNTLFKLSNFGTQNLFENIYCQGGSSVAQAVAAPVVFSSGGTAMGTSNFINFNIEWCISNRLIYGDTVRGFAFTGLHMEGNQLTGADPCFIEMVSSDGFAIRDALLLQNRCHTTDGASGTGTIIKGAFADRAIIDSMTIRNEAGAVTVNLPLYLFRNSTSGARWGSVTFNNFGIADNSTAQDVITNFRFHTKMSETGYLPSPVAGFYITNYSFESVLPVFRGGSVSLRDSSHTHYAVFEDFTYRRGTAGSVSRDLTLSNKRGPSGSYLQNLPAKQGQTVCVTRTSAWASPIVVKNHDGTTLASLTGDTEAMFYYDGTNWVLA